MEINENKWYKIQLNSPALSEFAQQFLLFPDLWIVYKYLFIY